MHFANLNLVYQLGADRQAKLQCRLLIGKCGPVQKDRIGTMKSSNLQPMQHRNWLINLDYV